jgi:hypothetical protein
MYNSIVCTRTLSSISLALLALCRVHVISGGGESAEGERMEQENRTVFEVM